MARVYLSLGSSVGDRVEHLRAAIRLLETTPGIRFVDASRVYETEPWEQAPGQIPSRASWFFNSVVAIETTLDLADLLARPHEIERGFDRVRSTAPDGGDKPRHHLRPRRPAEDGREDGDYSPMTWMSI